jgi:peptidyl-prolyl cis-trans isomerase C
MKESRTIPIQMAEGALSQAALDAGPANAVVGMAPVLVRVADTDVSEADIAREMQHHPHADPHVSRKLAAQALAVRILLLKEIERLAITPQAVPVDAETQEEAAIRVLLERELPVPESDESACRHYYENNRQRLHSPDRVLVRHILLAAAPDDVSGRLKARDRAEQLIAELQEFPERFTEMAMRFSDCPSKDQGGELGWISHGQTTPEFERQVFMLREGLAGLSVESRWGYHVVDVQRHERGQPLAFEDCAGRIARYLDLQSRQNAIQNYLQMLSAHYGVHGIDMASLE